ncbi:MAG: putative MFS-type transporter YhjX [Alphaproteobacteria bacterium MarineAlpha10_Bin1]|nr:MAG: putative MFS-type transporter YhjX [Alphaproteobacteria bacterium MarineAlpha10_Bin1]
MSLLPLIIAILVNFSMGSFYGWSVLVAPLEESIGATRSDISLAYSIAFVSMTVGMFITHSLLRIASLPYLLFVVFTIGALGMAISGYFVALWSLVVGYGVLLGFALGVSYFLAMTAASLNLPIRRSIAISMSMSAFAGGGLVWPPIFVAIIDWQGPHAVFLLFAAYLIVIGTVSAILMRAARPPAHSGAQEGGGVFSDIMTDRPRVFILLWFGFIFIAFAALMAIGHAAGIATYYGIPADQAYWGPMLSNLVYIGFALSAGILCDLITGRRVLIGIAAVMAVPLLVLYFVPSAGMSLVALALVGGAFGASSSAYPVTVTGYYGVAALPRIYGRLSSSYGLAGLLGPFAAGVLYDWEGGYNVAILIAGILATIGVFTVWALPKNRAPASAE